MRSNPIRFTGMASGMDTDSIVKDLMRPQQYKIDQEKKAQALIKLREDAWKDMNKKMYDFHTKFTHKLSQGGSFNASVATSSNENAVSIVGENSVPLGTHRFEIDNLATSASASGQVAKTFKVGEETKVLNGKTTVGELTGKEEATTLEMTINGKLISFKVEVGDTLSGVATKMNKALEGEGFKARYDAANGMFFINSTKPGIGQSISFDKGAGDGLFHHLGLTSTKVVDGQEIVEEKSGVVAKGLDAKYKYNGNVFESSTNNIEINGIKATLKSATAGEVIISSEPDGDATYNFIKEFVTEYNKLIDEVNEKLGSKPGRDIAPLTSQERDAMSESDIKLWEEKLNSSLFYKDPQLEKFASTARSILGSVLTGEGFDEKGSFNSLGSLGIVSGEWHEKGKLHILGDPDEENPRYRDKPNALKTKISENPEGVIKLLNTIGTKLYKAHGDTLKSGDLNSALSFYNDKAMKKQVDSYDKRIATLEERMYKMEDMQYRKFAAMEKMLSSLNNQGSWLAQQFGGM